MNKIAIVGHPASGYQEVEALLHQCGMQSARPSRREGLRPQDITATLCKAHKVPSVDAVTEEHDILQIQPGPVWHGMALDLMLGNLDRELWGWADPQAIFALDYWKDLDPKLTFVLVYDEPHRVLTEAARVHGELSPPNNVQRLLDNWVAYNGALLRFYLRHRDRCLLVHSQQVRRAVDSYLEQLQPLLDTALLRATEVEPVAAPAAVGVDGPHDEALSTQAPVALPIELESALAVAGIESRKALDVFNATAAEEYVVDAVLANHPAALQLYAELQSAANLPKGRTARAKGDPATAWQALVQQRTFVTGWVSELHAEYRRVREDLAESIERVAQLTNELVERDRRLQEHVRENEGLTVQLREAQEEARQQCLRQQQLEQRMAEQEREAQRQTELLARQSAEAKAQLEAARAEQARLEEKLKAMRAQAEADLVAARAKADAEAKAAAERAQQLGEENELLLNQLHQVQEELERYCLRQQQLEQRMAEQEREAQRQTELLAQQSTEAKAQLEAARAEQARLEEKLKAMRAQAEADLVAARAKADAEAKAAADRAQELGEENELLLNQLHQVQEELERYYLENQRLKQKLAPPKPPGPYGAADRIKRQLSYRLGAVMIERSRSVGGWLSMPWALAAEVRAFRQEAAARPAKKLPPIHTYRDAHEAERVKQHLSYRLGSTLLQHGKSPLGWLKLPFALRRQVREFRLQRKRNEK
ncbi:MAG: hypothetical protein KatS3mg122_1772 [Caldimonas sp.]|nr:MAG: hypothetical protein KatS3mg122_1772 [Caldimonas sp.]